MNILKIYLLLPFLLIINSGFSQYLPNPSFEGVPGQWSVAPSEWFTCQENSTPDLQPGVKEVTLPPSDGNSYTSLVTRGNVHKYPYSTEDMYTRLEYPMYKGRSYTISIDLARSVEFVERFSSKDYFYNGSVALNIYGSLFTCQDEIHLGYMGVVYDSTWSTYTIRIDNLQKDIGYIHLVAAFGSDWGTYGCILIDNLKIEDKNGDPNSGFGIYIPNVITPNGDGKNDKFLIKGLPSNSEITIFNRIGEILYQNKNYQNDWDGIKSNGEKLRYGTYWYIIKTPNFPNEFKGYVLIKK